MATTINQSFLQFKSNLEITGLQQQTVSALAPISAMRWAPRNFSNSSALSCIADS